MHPAADPLSELAGSAHWLEPLQTAGETQSKTVWHDVWHPAAVHVYGEQSVVCPLAPVIVWLPSQVTPATHLPVEVSHLSPGAQSVSLAHWSLHDVPPHAYGAHCFVTGAGQFPWPSQVAGNVAISLAQLAWRQVTDEPTNAAQDVRVVPSHSAAVHGSVAVPTGHAGLVPCGLPATGVHVPALPCTSHASHSPVHAASQQTPSTQNPLTQAVLVPHD
jgi:hypothetical protein